MFGTGLLSTTFATLGTPEYYCDHCGCRHVSITECKFSRDLNPDEKIDDYFRQLEKNLPDPANDPSAFVNAEFELEQALDRRQQDLSFSDFSILENADQISRAREILRLRLPENY